jgi:phosphomethylpyrimidine synthase
MCGPHFCSTRITEDVRRYAVEHGITEEAAIEKGMQEKSTQFAAAGDLYQKA